MGAVAVDASVWIAAQDRTDPCRAPSRLFFRHAVSAGVVIHVPAFARIEVACALARKLRNAGRGQRLASLVLAAANAREHPINAALLAKALPLGTTMFLRGADALYAAVAEIAGCGLVSWDKEHMERAGALTPDAWMVANP
jgi:predicted nucleic acid-binding protein